MKLIEKFTYGFDDVSLEPVAMSDVYSRKTDVDTSVKLTDWLTLETPIIASPMADVCDDKVAIAIHKAGGIGCIHRFQSIEEEAQMVQATVEKTGWGQVFAAVGTTEDFMDRAQACYDHGASGIIVDVAFLNKRTLEVCEAIRRKFPDIYLISGNVATGAGFRMGVEVGLNAVRVGIGNGQACRTSRVTGVGIGLVTSLMECFEEAEEYGVKVICDGGLDTGGSFCKALAAGAYVTIMGRALAATHESPGRVFLYSKDGSRISPEVWQNMKDEDRKKCYKEYRGSASMESQLVYKARGDIVSSEGVASRVQVYGSVADVVGRFNGALRSSMSYLGAHNLDEFRSNAVFRLIAQGVFNQEKARSLKSYEVTV